MRFNRSFCRDNNVTTRGMIKGWKVRGMFVANEIRWRLKEALMRAIEKEVDGRTFLNDLIRQGKMIRFPKPYRGPLGILPVPALTNVGDEIINLARENQETLAMLSSEKGRLWVRKNTDGIINYLLELSKGENVKC